MLHISQFLKNVEEQYFVVCCVRARLRKLWSMGPRWVFTLPPTSPQWLTFFGCLILVLESPPDELSSFVGSEIEGARNLATSSCKYNLKKLSHKVLNVRQNYELIRDRRRKWFEKGKGPRVFQKNRLPEELANKTCDLPRKNLALAFFVSMPKNVKRHTGGCIAHYGSHETEIPYLTVYDCNGTVIKCEEWGFGFSVPKKQNVLVVLTPDTVKKPDAFMFYFQKRRQHSLWCDWYPFWFSPKSFPCFWSVLEKIALSIFLIFFFVNEIKKNGFWCIYGLVEKSSSTFSLRGSWQHHTQRLNVENRILQSRSEPYSTCGSTFWFSDLERSRDNTVRVTSCKAFNITVHIRCVLS